MSPLRPHLIRALMGWVEENGMTPHVMVDANVPGVMVPLSAIKGGKVILNLSMRATQGMQIEDSHMVFMARFSGRQERIWLPMESIQAIYAAETGVGMGLPPEVAGAEPNAPSPPATPPGPPDDVSPPPRDRSHLRVIK